MIMNLTSPFLFSTSYWPCTHLFDLIVIMLITAAINTSTFKFTKLYSLSTHAKYKLIMHVM